MKKPLQATKLDFETRLDERFWLMRNLALGIVDHLEVSQPPVKIEALVASPPRAIEATISDLSKCMQSLGLREGSRCGVFSGHPSPRRVDLPECRYCACRQMLQMIVRENYGYQMGLADVLSKDYENCQDYFARVLLAPDALVEKYRSAGRKLGDFATTFVIPQRVAFIRWMDPVFP
jgi:hypothetical protein